METGRVAYFILESVRNEKGEYIPCIAKEGESGYYKTDWAWGKDLLLAEQCATEKNAMLGLSERDAQAIVLSTMQPTH